MPDEINTNPVSAESEEAQEDINALRQIRLDKLNEPFEQRPILICPVRLDNRANGIENLRRSLNELRLSRVLLLNVKYHVVNIAHIITPKTICGKK